MFSGVLSTVASTGPGNGESQVSSVLSCPSPSPVLLGC